MYDATDDRDPLEALADVLWAERHLMEYLLFKLVTAKLLLTAGERRFVPRAMDEVERVLERLHEVERRREAALVPVALELDAAADDLTLATLSTRAPEPMATVFRDLHQGLMKLADEIEETSATNRRLANAGLNQVRSTLDNLTGPSVTTTYTARGTHAHMNSGPVRLDEVL
jgi:FlgN protein